MSYYQFDRQEILQKAKEKYSKAAEYYLQNKEAFKKRQDVATKTYQEKKRKKLKSIKKRSIKN